MAGLRDLKKRLRSIRTTGQIAGAMRTAAAARFSRVNAALSAYRPYYEACETMLRKAGGAQGVENNGDAPVLTVLMASNRGFCGGFNWELFTYFKKLCHAQSKPRRIVTCGKTAGSFCNENGIEVEKSFEVSDIPTYDEADALAEYLMRAYEEGSVSEIELVMERFVNTLYQSPESRTLLPLRENDEEEDDDALYLPDKASIKKQLAKMYFEAKVYGALLENAAGAQAATLMAMRKAYDNAEESAADLEIAINRRRQAAVTENVLEISDDGI